MRYRTRRKMNRPLYFFGLTSGQWALAALLPCTLLLVHKWLFLISLPLQVILIHRLRKGQERLSGTQEYLIGLWVCYRSPKHINDHSSTLNKLIK